ncbi:uncharacterized protein BX664DRAFT_342484 [Halteromyces radiatus]|uniref:uncharacterized protein n=1 Tax=Halteromyces radiatus TaxID=101107 RepID=UPI002220A9A0|nr:uncharacterized protein BX664DRAFT_342484 [Halteromyces radiatus]KAI8078686.1 hypothetical protein BX664DRAFT_342484 [Halteromyces radiatus]
MPSITPTLFTPIKIGKHTLQHRIVLPPLTRMRNDDDHKPTDDSVEYYKQRSTPGGLLIAEGTVISHDAGGYPGTPGIYTTEQIEAWKKVTDAVHDKGAIIFLQIFHHGRTSPAYMFPDNHPPVSASPIAVKGISYVGFPYETPRALEIEEIQSITQDFVRAAENAIAAGFDGVEIHAANGYLLDQFINTSSNKRTDQYGGSIQNRARFPLEVVDAVAKAIGDDKTAIRFSPWSEFQDMEDDTPVATWSYITEQLEKTHPGLAYLHYIEPRVNLLLDGPEEGEKVDTLDPFRALWSGPFISAGHYTFDIKSSFHRAETSPNNLVAIGRAFTSNPDLVERIRNNWPIAPYHRPTLYSTGPVGYIDFPPYSKNN